VSPEAIAVVPAGIWGTALGIVLADNGCDVRLWHRDRELVDAVNRHHSHPRAGFDLPPNVVAYHELEAAVDGAGAIIVVPASQGFRAVSRALAPLVEPGQLLLTATKGIEPTTHFRMSDILAECIPDAPDRAAVLSGPNFAVEVARRLPTSTVVASRSRTVAEYFQSLLSNQNFRVYINPDVVGVELAGSLKNVLAIGVGISSGMGLGHNTAAALITRGITELTRLGLALGAHPLTFAGLAGLGDIVLTCTSDLSRNRQTGVLLGQGHRLEDILSETHMTVEGIRTAQAAYELGCERQIELPIVEQVYNVLYHELSLQQAVQNLMERTQKQEIEEAFLDGLAGLQDRNW